MSGPLTDTRICGAAKAMREQHGPDHPRHEMWEAMADLLDLIGTDYAPYWNEPYAAAFVPVIASAVKTAVAYNKAAS